MRAQLELRTLLAADVVAYNDGGGKARAARYEIVGADSVIGFVRSLAQHFPLQGEPRLIEVNGHAAALITFGDQSALVALGVKGRRDPRDLRRPQPRQAPVPATGARRQALRPIEVLG